jgi:hypothetical protein
MTSRILLATLGLLALVTSVSAEGAWVSGKSQVTYTCLPDTIKPRGAEGKVSAV